MSYWNETIIIEPDFEHTCEVDIFDDGNGPYLRLKDLSRKQLNWFSDHVSFTTFFSVDFGGEKKTFIRDKKRGVLVYYSENKAYIPLDTNPNPL